MIKKIDCYKCKICRRVVFHEKQQTFMEFLEKCPFCGGDMKKDETIYMIDNKKEESVFTRF